MSFPKYNKVDTDRTQRILENCFDRMGLYCESGRSRVSESRYINLDLPDGGVYKIRISNHSSPSCRDADIEVGGFLDSLRGWGCHWAEAVKSVAEIFNKELPPQAKAQFSRYKV